mmetsp:Transcript_3377/g.10211  ORF Transcript_3377/g.10211 Transcript_3377/m.10211 type:complete len:467 (-) Transcript_3377:125-1525(-)
MDMHLEDCATLPTRRKTLREVAQTVLRAHSSLRLSATQVHLDTLVSLEGSLSSVYSMESPAGGPSPKQRFASSDAADFALGRWADPRAPAGGDFRDAPQRHSDPPQRRSRGSADGDFLDPPQRRSDPRADGSRHAAVGPSPSRGRARSDSKLDGGPRSTARTWYAVDTDVKYRDDRAPQSSTHVGNDYLRKHRPRDRWGRDRRGCCTARWRSTRCISGVGADGTAVAWNTKSFLGRGLHRETFLGTYTAGPKQGGRCVVKQLIDRREGPSGMPELMRKDIEVCAAAIALAGEFNALYKGTGTRALRFNASTALRVSCAGSRSKFHVDEWVTVEDYYAGHFERLLGNDADVDYENNRGSISTFCHWTYHRTRGRWLITDIQGVRPAHDEVYLLTDPAMHSAEGDWGGPLDHGVDGIHDFFSTHECTRRCSRLLKPKDLSDGEIIARRFKITGRAALETGPKKSWKHK